MEITRSLAKHPNLITETLIEVCVEKGVAFAANPMVLSAFNEWDPIICKIKTKTCQAEFHLQQMPGCCAVMILYFLHPSPNTEKNFKEVLEIIEEATKRAAFGSLLMAQVIPDKGIRDANWHLAMTMGYVLHPFFTNPKSGNKVVYLTKDMGFGKQEFSVDVKIPDPIWNKFFKRALGFMKA